MLINRQTLKSISRGLFRLQRYCYSFTRERIAIFNSQYHLKGRLDYRVPRQIQQLLTKNHENILNLREELDISRNIVLSRAIDTSEGSIIKLKEEDKQIIEKYLQLYQSLMKIVSLCPINNEYIFKLIGWYNIISLYKTLVERLIEAKGQELKLLVESLSWMTYKWNNPYGRIDQDMFNGKNIDNFYKRLIDEQLPLSYIRMIQKILVVPINYSKRIFFDRYFTNNVDQFLKMLTISQNYNFSDIIWLMHNYVKNMNDQQGPFGVIEKYIITNRPQLSRQNIERLMDSYLLKGGINQIIYKDIIKPYIFKYKMSEIGDVIEMIKFAICSQCKDDALIKTLYQLIQVLFQSNKISASKQMYILHLYTHYLKIKGYRIHLSPILFKQMNSFCKERSQGRSSINKIVFDSMTSQNKAKPFGRQKHISPCLNTAKNMPTQFQPTKKSQFQKDFGTKLKQFNLRDCTIYEKPIFCCFELDYCLHNKARSELFDIQIQGIQYVFSSGKLVRERQIKDEILSHYKIKINHIDYNGLRRNKHLSIDDILMYKKNNR